MLFRSSSWARRVSFFADVPHAGARRFQTEFLEKHILLADRYLYDTLADTLYKEDGQWLFAEFGLKMIPQPDLPVFVQVAPEEAFRRKCEYPLDYLKWRDQTYGKIFSKIPGALVIQNIDLEKSQRILASAVLAKLERKK